jgi:hypothetical protein
LGKLGIFAEGFDQRAVGRPDDPDAGEKQDKDEKDRDIY